MLGHWMAHRARHGGAAQGVFFRRKYKMLDRVRDRGIELLKATGAKFLTAKDQYRFVWPDGSCLRLRHLDSTEDAGEYQGHEYNWICFEEATQWASPAPLDMLRATLRNAINVPCWLLLTCNPGGVGHQWVKDRYIIKNRAGYTPITLRVPIPGKRGFIEKEAVFIPAKVWDNQLLLKSVPDYIDSLYLSGPEWLVRAWLEGDWDIVAGGYLEGVWAPERHIVAPFMPPTSWPRFRAMDWGFASPYSIGWYAMDPDNKKLYRYRELYGYGGSPNVGTRESALEVKERILELEALEVKGGVEFRKNPADRSIWNKIGTQSSIIDLFLKGEVRTPGGVAKTPVKWSKADNVGGSRKVLNALVVAMLRHDQFAVTADCEHFIRTVPVIPADEDDPEDVDTTAEDHAYDEFKMAMGSRRRAAVPPAGDKPAPLPYSGPWLQGIRDGTYTPPKPITA